MPAVLEEPKPDQAAREPPASQPLSSVRVPAGTPAERLLGPPRRTPRVRILCQRRLRAHAISHQHLASLLALSGAPARQTEQILNYIAHRPDPYAAASREILELVQSGEADREIVGELVDVLLEAEVPFRYGSAREDTG